MLLDRRSKLVQLCKLTDNLSCRQKNVESTVVEGRRGFQLHATRLALQSEKIGIVGQTRRTGPLPQLPQRAQVTPHTSSQSSSSEVTAAGTPLAAPEGGTPSSAVTERFGSTWACGVSLPLSSSSSAIPRRSSSSSRPKLCPNESGVCGVCDGDGGTICSRSRPEI
eukprot:COSAG02_NODE_2174_length_9589_cov_49.732561_4_plen_166_part_00